MRKIFDATLIFSPGLVALHITTLFTISVAHPLYDLFTKADHSAFFVAHQAKTIDIWLLVLVLSLLLPLVLTMILWLTVLLSRRLAGWLYLLVFFLLTAALLLPAFDRLFPQLGEMGIVLALSASAITTLAYRYSNSLRFFFSLFSLIVIVSPALFLTSSPIHTFLSAPENQDYRILSRNDRPPNIVMLVFDELPLTSLLDKDGLVDRERYPNFYRLVKNSTWYRNAAATHTITRAAAPAMLTGVLRHSGDESLQGKSSIFTLLAPTHRIVAMEHATLLARAVNDEGGPRSALADRFAGELGDVGLIYAHLAIPRRFTGKLPAIDNQWNHFGTEIPGQQQPDPAWPYLGHWPGKVKEFIGLLEEPSFPPKFYFLHLLMPHQPFQYDQEGHQHSYKLPTVRRQVTGRNEIASEYMATLLYQAHLLKLSFGDRLLGHILQRLDELGLYETSMIIVVADHGISFYWERDGDEKRLLEIQTEDIANIPLFIKSPNQTEGTISEIPIQTHDIVPTVADLLGIEIPWRTDGLSAFDVTPARKRSAYLGKRIDLDTLIDPERRSLRRKLELFGQGVNGLYNIGPDRELIGQSVDGFVRKTLGDTVTLVDRKQFQNISPASASLPAYVEGRIGYGPGHSGNPESDRLTLAIAVNDIIRATTQVWEEQGELRFLCRLPPESFSAGDNDIRVYGVVPDEAAGVAWLLNFAGI